MINSLKPIKKRRKFRYPVIRNVYGKTASKIRENLESILDCRHEMAGMAVDAVCDGECETCELVKSVHSRISGFASTGSAPA